MGTTRIRDAQAVQSIDLTSEVTGTLPVPNGGTGAATITGLVKGNGTSAMTAAAAGTDFVAPGGVLGTPSSGVLTNLTGYPNTALVHTTRTGIYQFEHSNALTSFGSLHTRRPFMITQKPIRFRLHIRNYDLLGNASSTGTLTGVTAYIGPMAVDANGNLNGNFSVAPTQIQTSTTLASGATEIITGWISPGTFTINSYKWYGISVGWTATAQQVANGGGLHWSTATPGDAATAAPAGLARADNQGFLNMYIEYEFANDLSPIILVVSNSLSGGGNTSALANRGEVDAWCGQWALRNGGTAAILAAGGAWLSHFASTSTRWNYYSTLNTALDPDYVVFFATGSSDIAGAAGVSTVQTELYDSMSKARALWPNAQILLTTNPPRLGSGTAAVEADRKTFNTWLTTSPGIASSCIDLEPVVTDDGKQLAMQPAATGAVTLVGETMPRLDPFVDSGDHEHWKPYAHARVTTLMPGTRQIAV